jgi:sugar/nucleoside kinase (ribokinase family)
MSTPMDAAARRAVELVRREGASVSVDLASVSVIRSFGPERLREMLADLRADVVFANEAEHELVGTDGEAIWVVKRGADGCTVVQGGRRSDHPAVGADVIDTTGAGDAFAAGYLVGGIELALATAARCVGKLGAMP